MKRFLLATVLGGLGLLPPATGATVEQWLKNADAYLARASGPAERQPNGSLYAASIPARPLLLQLALDLPAAPELPALRAELEKRIRRGGKQAAKWRALRVLVLTLSEPTERLAERVREDLDKLVPPLRNGDEYARLQPNLRHAIEDLQPAAPTSPARPADEVAIFLGGLEAATADWARLNTPPQRSTSRAEAARRAGGEAKLRRLEELRAVVDEQGEEYHRIATRGDVTGATRAALEAEWERKKKAWEASLNAADRRLLGLLRVRRDEALEKYLSHPSELLHFEREDHRPAEIVVPDLIALVGESRVREILQAALRQPAVFLTASPLPDRMAWSPELPRAAAIGSSKGLLKELVQQSVATLAVPQFQLVDSLELGPLYHAMAQRFPLREVVLESHGPLQESTAIRFSAQGHYVLWLVSVGRQAEALVEMKNLTRLLGRKDMRPTLPDEGYRVLAAMGKSAEACDFLLALFAQDPLTSEVAELPSLAAKAGRTKEVRAMVERLAARQDVSVDVRLRAEQTAADVLLASDDLEGAAAALQRLAALPRTDSKEDGSRINAAQQLAHLGRCLGRSDWEAAGVEHVVRIGLENPREDGVTAMLRALEDAKKFERIVELTKDFLAEAGPAVLPKGGGQQKALSARFQALVELGRFAEALEFLQTDVRWNFSDLSEMLDDRAVTMAAARALRGVGKTAEARRVTEAAILVSPGSDEPYALLRELAGAEARPFLERVAGLFPYEERPLIWRARALLDLGQVEEAEKVVRDAIRIDPSDGEQRAPDRMRAYAVLAEIMRSRGDTKQAEFFEGVVRAIRKSEQADLLAGKSLHQRALVLYRESLEAFADAYCIQSRLARKLYEQGRVEEAMVHYRRAFELMPDSFGRMESHCFGCEKAFSGEEPQKLAETVFQGALARDPGKPQAHYLLGYLRLEQRRYDEAARHFLRAVELDPLYLNAWDRLAAIESQLTTPPVASRSRLQALRLNPLQANFNYDDRRGRVDYVALWQTVREVHALRLKFDAELSAGLLPMRGETYEKRELRAPQLLQWAWQLPVLRAIEDRLRD